MTDRDKNKILAEFMGLIVVSSGTKCLGEIKYPEVSEAFLKYDSSWSELKKVIDKCYEISSDDEKTFGGFLLSELGLGTDIETAFNAAVEYAKSKK